MTPPVWMEARCGTVLGENPGDIERCMQTSEGAFFRNFNIARKFFRKQGWEATEECWLCPKCAAEMRRKKR